MKGIFENMKRLSIVGYITLPLNLVNGLFYIVNTWQNWGEQKLLFFKIILSINELCNLHVIRNYWILLN